MSAPFTSRMHSTRIGDPRSRKRAYSKKCQSVAATDHFDFKILLADNLGRKKFDNYRKKKCIKTVN